MTASFAAAGMLGGGLNLILVGGSEVMSRPSLALTAEASKRLTDLFAQDPAAALAALGALTPQDYVLPTKGWANRLTGRTMGDHMEETAKAWRISREAQDDWALKSHQRAVAGWNGGFFDDLVISLPELSRDANPRADTSAERLSGLKPAFDRESGMGSLTAGNSSPITDGAAGCWVSNEEGLKRLPDGTPYARIIDYEVSAVDLRTEGLLMAPSYAVPRLLARHHLGFADIALWEIHEAFAAQALPVLKDLKLLDKMEQKVNLHGGAIALGHPFGCSGARISGTLLNVMKQNGGTFGVSTMCIGLGQGITTVFERV